MSATTTPSARPVSVPNFTGSYPLGGELIGPAWRTAWGLLSRDSSEWVEADRLVLAMCADGIADKTARGLLNGARRAGLLDVRYRVTGRPTRRRAEYRIDR